MTRTLLYAGAVGNLDITKTLALGAEFAVQPKIDGQFATVHLDGAGRVSHVFLRSGRQPLIQSLGPIFRARIGAPWSIYAGELETGTESATRINATRGYPLLHLFDCIRDGKQDVTRLPYSARRDALYRGQSSVIDGGGPFTAEAGGDIRSRKSGKYSRFTPTDWRVAPIVPQVAPARASELWDQVKADRLEGLVAVSLKAPLGARLAKRKVKPWETLDATVVQVGPRQVHCQWHGHHFALGRGKHAVKPGDVVEVRHSGFYESAVIPRFASLVRVRMDLDSGLL